MNLPFELFLHPITLSYLVRAQKVSWFHTKVMEQGKKEMKRILVTFDIDGTMIQSTGANSNHFYLAFSHAFLQVFGIHGTIDIIQVLYYHLIVGHFILLTNHISTLWPFLFYVWSRQFFIVKWSRLNLLS